MAGTRQAVANFWAALSAAREGGCASLREAGPVVERDGVYCLTRSADVLGALRNPEVFSSARRPRHRGFDVVDLPRVPTMVDSPEHIRYRKILQPLFSPQVVKELLPGLTELAAALVDAVAAGGECDAMTAVAAPYATDGLMMFCGLPLEDGDWLRDWVCAIHTDAQDGPYLSAVFAMFGYLAAAISQRRRNPGGFGGLLSRLPTSLSDAEALGASYLMVGAGFGDVIAAIGFALLALASDPPLRLVLCADPEQLKPFVEEVLRLAPPVSMIERVATRDVTIGDVTIPAGSPVKLNVSAVNREESSDLSVIDGQVGCQRHWTFGAGPHGCPAAYFARVEVTVMVSEWLRRIPDFEVDEPGYGPHVYAAVYCGDPFGLPSLPLRWDNR